MALISKNISINVKAGVIKSITSSKVAFSFVLFDNIAFKLKSIPQIQY